MSDNPYFSELDNEELDMLCLGIAKMLHSEGRWSPPVFIRSQLEQLGGYQPDPVIKLAVRVVTSANMHDWFADRLVAVQSWNQKAIDNEKNI